MSKRNTYVPMPWYKTATFLSSLVGGIILLACTFITQLKENQSQCVDWRREPPGMEIDHKFSLLTWPGNFIKWDDLKEELWSEVLLQIDGINRNEYVLKLADNNEKKNTFIQIVRVKDSVDVAHVWLGWNPWKDNHDGLIRVGRWAGHCELWKTFQRHTNNRYYLVEDRNVPDSVKTFLKPDGQISNPILKHE